MALGNRLRGELEAIQDSGSSFSNRDLQQMATATARRPIHRQAEIPRPRRRATPVLRPPATRARRGEPHVPPRAWTEAEPRFGTSTVEDRDRFVSWPNPTPSAPTSLPTMRSAPLSSSLAATRSSKGPSRRRIRPGPARDVGAFPARRECRASGPERSRARRCPCGASWSRQRPAVVGDGRGHDDQVGRTGSRQHGIGHLGSGLDFDHLDSDRCRQGCGRHESDLRAKLDRSLGNGMTLSSEERFDRKRTGSIGSRVPPL